MSELVPAGAWFDDAIAERDPATAARIVGEPGRLLAAAVNPEVAVVVLRAIAALAWRTDEAAAILARVARWPDVPAVKRALERTQLDLAAAREYRQVFSPVLAAVPVRDGGAGAVRRSGAAAGHRRGAARRADRRSGAATWRSLDTLHARCYDLSEALTLRLVEDVAWPRRELPHADARDREGARRRPDPPARRRVVVPGLDRRGGRLHRRLRRRRHRSIPCSASWAAVAPRRWSVAPATASTVASSACRWPACSPRSA